MKVVLVDDHQIFREGLRAILEREPGFVVAGEAANGSDAIQLVRCAHPDVVLMDVTMPDLNGIDATKLIVADNPRVKVIGLSMNSGRQHVIEMLAAGAVGYLVKTAAADELVRAIHAVMAGQTYLSPQISGFVVNALVRQATPTNLRVNVLSTREREVLQLLAEGLTSKDIAILLSVAVSTVETHRKQIMTKLDLRSIAELTKYAVREGLTTLE